MDKKTAENIVRDFLMDRLPLNSDVYEAIRVQYLIASSVADDKAAA